ncbi:MAG: sugar phosphate isomerase/epimerase [Victivallales bacterium]|nr:sugar phosphate isomerase/epimerase [Victivallales bacterium]
MKIGTVDGGFTSIYGDKEGLRRLRALGFECLDENCFVNTEQELFKISEKDYEKRLVNLRRLIEDADLEINQTHGPWRWPPRDATPEDRAERFEKMTKSILGTVLLGSKNFVIHPIMPFTTNDASHEQETWEMNLEFFGRLCEVARQHEVVICFENMPWKTFSLASPEAITRFAKQMNSPWFKVCLDTGHSLTLGIQPADGVRQIGKEYLQVLHVHDNNGVNDCHWLPYNGIGNWEEFTKALQEIGFDGTLSMETSLSRKLPVDIRDNAERMFFQIAAKLAGRL